MSVLKSIVVKFGILFFGIFAVVGFSVAQEIPANPTACLPGYTNIVVNDGYGNPTMLYHVPVVCGYVERDTSLPGFIPLGTEVNAGVPDSAGVGLSGVYPVKIIAYQFAYYPEAYPNTMRRPLRYLVEYAGKQFGVDPEWIPG